MQWVRKSRSKDYLDAAVIQLVKEVGELNDKNMRAKEFASQIEGYNRKLAESVQPSFTRFAKVFDMFGKYAIELMELSNNSFKSAGSIQLVEPRK